MITFVKYRNHNGMYITLYMAYHNSQFSTFNSQFLLDKHVLHHKQHCQYIQRDVEFLEVAADNVDGNVRDNTAEDTVRNAVCQRHHDDGDECRDRLSKVVEVDILDWRQHEQTYDYENRCCGCSRDREEYRSEE